MTSTTIDYIGTVADTATQGLGRLIGQYVNSPKFIALLTGIYDLANDMELMFQKIARFYNIDDDCSANTPNTSGATGAQLLGIGRLVGMTNKVPAADGSSIDLADAQFIRLIRAKIYRNTVKGGTIPQLLYAIQLVMPDLVTVPPADPLIIISEVQPMTVLIAIGRAMYSWEEGAFAITGGISMIKGALLPRPDGVLLATYWFDTGSFCFSSSDDPGVALVTGGLGFNEDPASTTGHWARSF